MRGRDRDAPKIESDGPVNAVARPRVAPKIESDGPVNALARPRVRNVCCKIYD